jgi:hypothetical protein
LTLRARNIASRLSTTAPHRSIASQARTEARSYLSSIKIEREGSGADSVDVGRIGALAEPHNRAFVLLLDLGDGAEKGEVLLSPRIAARSWSLAH